MLRAVATIGVDNSEELLKEVLSELRLADVDFTEDAIRYQCTTSRAIRLAAWKENYLLIHFVGGAEVVYHDVPRHIFLQLIFADSLGEHFNQYIRGKYNSTSLK